MMLSRKRSSTKAKSVNVDLGGEVISCQNEVKYLGVTIDEELKWTSLVENIRKRNLTAIKRASTHLPFSTLAGALRIIVTFSTLFSQLGLSTGNVTHVILDTRPSCFSRTKLKSCVGPGDEATSNLIMTVETSDQAKLGWKLSFQVYLVKIQLDESGYSLLCLGKY